MENKMKILICYFSGTGNTRMVVNKYVENLKNEGVETDLYKIESNNFQYDVTDYEMIGIAYPVHAFNAPSIVLNFAKSLPECARKRVFIVNTSGEPLKINNISSIKLRKILKNKGYNVTNEYHYCMPYNIIFRHTDNMAYKMWKTAQEVIPVDCKELLSGKYSLLEDVFMGSFIAWLFRIEHWGGRFNGKRYKVSENCIHCGKCVNICPTHNITLKDGEFHFGKNCLMCMRCSFLCPKSAIKIGLFEKWKVNGMYNFNNANKFEDEVHKNYCKKSYERYFRECEEKVSAVKVNVMQEEDEDEIKNIVKV